MGTSNDNEMPKCPECEEIATGSLDAPVWRKDVWLQTFECKNEHMFEVVISRDYKDPAICWNE